MSYVNCSYIFISLNIYLSGFLLYPIFPPTIAPTIAITGFINCPIIKFVNTIFNKQYNYCVYYFVQPESASTHTSKAGMQHQKGSIKSVNKVAGKDV